MSFGSAARRVRETSRPLGNRVAYLHGCLQEFNLFGYHTTRSKLRAIVGASGPGWTEQQILDALNLLESAQISWAAYLAEHTAKKRALKRRDRDAYKRTRFDGAFQA